MAEPCDSNRGECSLVCTECPTWHSEPANNTRFKQLHDLALAGDENAQADLFHEFGVYAQVHGVGCK